MIIPDDKTPLFPSSPFRSSVAWKTGIPESSEPVTTFAMDRRGPYVLPFKCSFRDGAWRNAATGESLQVYIEGWIE